MNLKNNLGLICMGLAAILSLVYALEESKIAMAFAIVFLVLTLTRLNKELK